MQCILFCQVPASISGQCKPGRRGSREDPVTKFIISKFIYDEMSSHKVYNYTYIVFKGESLYIRKSTMYQVPFKEK
jgi:hypothetical protein